MSDPFSSDFRRDPTHNQSIELRALSSNGDSPTPERSRFSQKLPQVIDPEDQKQRLQLLLYLYDLPEDQAKKQWQQDIDWLLGESAYNNNSPKEVSEVFQKQGIKVLIFGEARRRSKQLALAAQHFHSLSLEKQQKILQIIKDANRPGLLALFNHHHIQENTSLRSIYRMDNDALLKQWQSDVDWLLGKNSKQATPSELSQLFIDSGFKGSPSFSELSKGVRREAQLIRALDAFKEFGKETQISIFLSTAQAGRTGLATAFLEVGQFTDEQIIAGQAFSTPSEPFSSSTKKVKKRKIIKQAGKELYGAYKKKRMEAPEEGRKKSIRNVLGDIRNILQMQAAARALKNISDAEIRHFALDQERQSSILPLLIGDRLHFENDEDALTCLKKEVELLLKSPWSSSEFGKILEKFPHVIDKLPQKMIDGLFMQAAGRFPPYVTTGNCCQFLLNCGAEPSLHCLGKIAHPSLNFSRDQGLDFILQHFQKKSLNTEDHLEILEGLTEGHREAIRNYPAMALDHFKPKFSYLENGLMEFLESGIIPTRAVQDNSLLEDLETQQKFGKEGKEIVTYLKDRRPLGNKEVDRQLLQSADPEVQQFIERYLSTGHWNCDRGYYPALYQYAGILGLPELQEKVFYRIQSLIGEHRISQDTLYSFAAWAYHNAAILIDEGAPHEQTRTLVYLRDMLKNAVYEQVEKGGFLTISSSCLNYILSLEGADEYLLRGGFSAAIPEILNFDRVTNTFEIEHKQEERENCLRFLQLLSLETRNTPLAEKAFFDLLERFSLQINELRILQRYFERKFTSLDHSLEEAKDHDTLSKRETKFLEMKQDFYLKAAHWVGFAQSTF